jgi:hypothetical protein
MRKQKKILTLLGLLEFIRATQFCVIVTKEISLEEFKKLYPRKN